MEDMKVSTPLSSVYFDGECIGELWQMVGSEDAHFDMPYEIEVRGKVLREGEGHVKRKFVYRLVAEESR